MCSNRRHRSACEQVQHRLLLQARVAHYFRHETRGDRVRGLRIQGRRHCRCVPVTPILLSRMALNVITPAGLEASRVSDSNGDLPSTVPFYGGVRANNQAHFNSYSYMVGLAEVLDKAGVPIYEMTRASQVRLGR